MPIWLQWIMVVAGVTGAMFALRPLIARAEKRAEGIPFYMFVVFVSGRSKPAM